ncbi:Xaa-Pro peptidase family protein [Litorilinea aerophila]|uniref:Aminopeptidase P family protein n=1 Tax=Litorilinea aerophila TaxID=1204385 RepID=A0A540VIR8_9CHLR|nr:Xaa-Pro peptidase family protein [Litorilinea aerophila]MCC9075903.1 Xaa-Pro peptidase family protein [Litorilinea aerophila]GIV77166.1 MAG: peptidase M24 [Litorilinea sp.]
MKADLDRLMEERNLDGLMVLGDSTGNKVLNYLTGGAHLERALVVKRRQGPLTLLHGSMERDTAARTGLHLVDRDATYNMYRLLEKHQGNRLAAMVDFLYQVMQDQGLAGRIGVYGTMDAGAAFVLLRQLQAIAPELEIVGEYEDSLFALARETKDEWELDQLREAGRLTCLIMGETQEFIQGHQARNGVVQNRDGEPLTIGAVKAFIRSRLAFHGLREDHETIFSQGRDAGVPHNSGDPAAPLRLGQSIVFDFFPVTASGYFHDITRTWSLGYATDEVWEAWAQCKEIFDRVMASLAVGQPCREPQLMTCDYFEAKGHPTVRSQPGTREGYVHSLGHGIGLDIHEEPRLSHVVGNDTVFQPGHVFSVEPGLYYPERGFGVRIEDSVAFNQAGELEYLSNYPYDLVIPIPGA